MSSPALADPDVPKPRKSLRTIANLRPDGITTSQGMRFDDPRRLVLLARVETPDAVRKLVDLMNGKPTKTKALNRDGEEVEIEIPVPHVVQLRAAELLLDRGWGKTPQAVLVADERSGPEGVAAIPIMERIAAIKAARAARGTTVDLEASEVEDVSSPPTQTPDGTHIPQADDLI